MSNNTSPSHPVHAPVVTMRTEAERRVVRAFARIAERLAKEDTRG